MEHVNACTNCLLPLMHMYTYTFSIIYTCVYILCYMCMYTYALLEHNINSIYGGHVRKPDHTDLQFALT